MITCHCNYSNCHDHLVAIDWSTISALCSSRNSLKNRIPLDVFYSCQNAVFCSCSSFTWWYVIMIVVPSMVAVATWPFTVMCLWLDIEQNALLLKSSLQINSQSTWQTDKCTDDEGLISLWPTTLPVLSKQRSRIATSVEVTEVYSISLEWNIVRMFPGNILGAQWVHLTSSLHRQ